MAFPVATPQDTEMHFIGSGAFSWSWWITAGANYKRLGDAPDDWMITGKFGENDEPEIYTLNHAAILRAIRAIAKLDPLVEAPARRYVSGGVIRECRTWIFKGADECDFDAPMADEVMQYAVCQSVVYG